MCHFKHAVQDPISSLLWPRKLTNGEAGADASQTRILARLAARATVAVAEENVNAYTRYTLPLRRGTNVHAAPFIAHCRPSRRSLTYLPTATTVVHISICVVATVVAERWSDGAAVALHLAYSLDTQRAPIPRFLAAVATFPTVFAARL